MTPRHRHQANRTEWTGGRLLPTHCQRLAAILGDVDVAGGAAEADAVAARVERVAVDDVVGVLLRQPLAEASPSSRRRRVVRATKSPPSIAHALIVALAGTTHAVRGVALVGGDGEAEVHGHVVACSRASSCARRRRW